jgi:hypothetical protein
MCQHVGLLGVRLGGSSAPSQRGRCPEVDAANAIDYAAWAVDNARIAVLDALDARAYATECAKAADAT